MSARTGIIIWPLVILRGKVNNQPITCGVILCPLCCPVCEPLPLKILDWSDIESMVAVAFSCVGILITSFVTFIFIQYRDTPVVKSSSRELCYIILAGIFLGYICPFTLIARPTVASSPHLNPHRCQASIVAPPGLCGGPTPPGPISRLNTAKGGSQKGRSIVTSLWRSLNNIAVGNLVAN